MVAWAQVEDSRKLCTQGARLRRRRVRAASKNRATKATRVRAIARTYCGAVADGGRRGAQITSASRVMSLLMRKLERRGVMGKKPRGGGPSQVVAGDRSSHCDRPVGQPEVQTPRRARRVLAPLFCAWQERLVCV